MRSWAVEPRPLFRAGKTAQFEFREGIAQMVSMQLGLREPSPAYLQGIQQGLTIVPMALLVGQEFIDSRLNSFTERGYDPSYRGKYTW